MRFSSVYLQEKRNWKKNAITELENTNEIKQQKR